MRPVQLLEYRVCNYDDYNDRLKDVIVSWRSVISRKDLNNRKDWEFCTMADMFMRHSQPTFNRVLDAACGREPLVDWLSTKVKSVVATDFWEPAYLAAASITLEDFLWYWRTLPNVSPMVMNSMTLQFSDGIFDTSFCVSSIEHMGAEDGRHAGAVRALNELIRVTKTGGLIAFTTEFKPKIDKGSWYFSGRELYEFITLFADASPLELDVRDGSDNKMGVHPVAFALRKL